MRALVIVLVIVGFLYLSQQTEKLPAGLVTEGQGTKCGGVGGFIKDHVGRKNAVAPTAVERAAKNYGVNLGKGTATTIAKYADALSVSGKVEGFVDEKIGDALCNLSPLQAAAAGAKWVGGKVAEGAEAVASGAEYVGSKVGSAAAAGARFGVSLARNPLSGVQPLNTLATKSATIPFALGSRATSAVYNSVPTPVKVAFLPAVVPAKVTARVATTTINAAGTVVSGVGRTLSSGAKGAEHAVSGAIHALGF